MKYTHTYQVIKLQMNLKANKLIGILKGTKKMVRWENV